MKRKTFIAILAIAMVLVLSLAILTACNSKKHDFSSKWEYDETSHWHECICGDKADTAAHTFEWVTDKEPTDDEKGSKHEECTVCHATRNEHTEIPATGEDCLFTKICKFIIKIITKFVLWILDFINGIC